jgi:hypothetical protein
MIFTILNNQLLVDGRVFGTHHVHYGELNWDKYICSYTVYIYGRNSVSF